MASSSSSRSSSSHLSQAALAAAALASAALVGGCIGRRTAPGSSAILEPNTQQRQQQLATAVPDESTLIAEAGFDHGVGGGGGRSCAADPSSIEGGEAPRRLRKAETVLQRRTARVIVVLEGSYDMHNQAAVLRTAE